jgi:hypothetical protein
MTTRAAQTREPVANRPGRCDERDAKHASVPLRRVRAGELRWEKFLYELKAGPAGGLRPPSGPATTPRSPGYRPHPPPRLNHTHQAIRRDRTDRGLGQPPPSGSGQLPHPSRPVPEDGHKQSHARAILSPVQPDVSARPRLAPSPRNPQPGRHAPWPRQPEGPLISELPVHARDFLLGLGHCLRCPGDLLPQRLALRLRLLGSLEPIGAVGVTVRHDRTGTLPDPALSPHRARKADPVPGRGGQERRRRRSSRSHKGVGPVRTPQSNCRGACRPCQRDRRPRGRAHPVVKGDGLTLWSSWYPHWQALRTSSSSAVPLPRHSQQSRPVPSGQSRITHPTGLDLRHFPSSQVTTAPDLALQAGGRLAHRL